MASRADVERRVSWFGGNVAWGGRGRRFGTMQLAAERVSPVVPSLVLALMLQPLHPWLARPDPTSVVGVPPAIGLLTIVVAALTRTDGPIADRAPPVATGA